MLFCLPEVWSNVFCQMVLWQWWWKTALNHLHITLFVQLVSHNSQRCWRIRLQHRVEFSEQTASAAFAFWDIICSTNVALCLVYINIVQSDLAMFYGHSVAHFVVSMNDCILIILQRAHLCWCYCVAIFRIWSMILIVFDTLIFSCEGETKLKPF